MGSCARGQIVNLHAVGSRALPNQLPGAGRFPGQSGVCCLGREPGAGIPPLSADAGMVDVQAAGAPGAGPPKLGAPPRRRRPGQLGPPAGCPGQTLHQRAEGWFFHPHSSVRRLYLISTPAGPRFHPGQVPQCLWNPPQDLGRTGRVSSVSVTVSTPAASPHPGLPGVADLEKPIPPCDQARWVVSPA